MAWSCGPPGPGNGSWPGCGPTTWTRIWLTVLPRRPLHPWRCAPRPWPMMGSGRTWPAARSRSWPRRNGPAAPPARHPDLPGRVREATAELGELISRLRSPGPLPVRGVAQVSVLFGDGRSPLYHRASQDDLRERLREATDALSELGLGSGTVSAAQVRGAGIEIQDRAAGLPGLRRGQVEHGRGNLLGGGHPAERALRADLVSGRAIQHAGRHVRLDETGRHARHRDAVRAERLGQRLAERV